MCVRERERESERARERERDRERKRKSERERESNTNTLGAEGREDHGQQDREASSGNNYFLSKSGKENYYIQVTSWSICVVTFLQVFGRNLLVPKFRNRG